MSKINIKKLREKNGSKIISAEEALKDVEPFEWNEEIKDKIILINELTKKIIELSHNKLSYKIANKLATNCLNNIDLNDLKSTHKGLTWYAKDILEDIDLDKYSKEE